MGEAEYLVIESSRQIELLITHVLYWKKVCVILAIILSVLVCLIIISYWFGLFSGFSYSSGSNNILS